MPFDFQLILLGLLYVIELSSCFGRKGPSEPARSVHRPAKPAQPVNMVRAPALTENDPAKMLQAIMKSNESHITGALQSIFGLLNQNMQSVTYDDPNVSAGSSSSSSSSSESSSSDDDFRRSIPKTRRKRELTILQVKKKLAALPKSYFKNETPWNETHNLAGIYPRLFRYRLCDLKYLRNICLYNIIASFEDVCEKYKCTETVLPRAWEVAKSKCKTVMVNGNVNPVWNGTFYYHRNGRLSYPIRNDKQEQIGIDDHGLANVTRIDSQALINSTSNDILTDEETESLDQGFLRFLLQHSADQQPVERPTRRWHNHFTSHHTHCQGVRDYCQKACYGTVRVICGRFKCTRLVSEALSLGCKSCNTTYIRHFPKELLYKLDFMKYPGKVQHLSNKTFEHYFEIEKLNLQKLQRLREQKKRERSRMHWLKKRLQYLLQRKRELERWNKPKPPPMIQPPVPILGPPPRPHPPPKLP